MPKAYYNEHDPKAAAWLQELIKAGLIAPGDVDTRDIQDISPNELTGYTQQHFFAGIGGWSFALRLAGWPDDRAVRTGSCPCQPFSAAGKGLGEADERHLWPVFRDLIAFGEPTTTFGEQVASAAGRLWLSRVRADLEGLGYAVGAADLCSAGVSAPNIRQRLYWMADAGHGQSRRSAAPREAQSGGGALSNATGCGYPCGLAYCDGERFSRRAEQDVCEVESELDASRRADAVRCCDACGLGDANNAGPQERIGEPGVQREEVGARAREAAQCGGHACWVDDTSSDGRKQGAEVFQGRCAKPSHAVNVCPWSDYELLPCTDGKARRIEPGSSPLAHGVSGRVGLLRGYGNAINPWLAAEFILSCRESGLG